MNIKCIALDLDRTTLRNDGTLSPKNKEALEIAIEKGIHIVVASGRSLKSLPEDILKIKGIEYAITSNGAAVYELESEKCLMQYKLSKESIIKILELTKNANAAYEVFIDGTPYAMKEYVEDPLKFGATEIGVTYIQKTRKPVDDIFSFIDTHIHELDCLDLIVKEEAKKLELWKMLKENVPDVYITSSVPRLLEISYKDAGKHSGARFILEHLNLKKEELAAFGDGDNDADLLSFANIGIAMENASDPCKKAANAITLSNEEDGVAYGIKNILKIY